MHARVVNALYGHVVPVVVVVVVDVVAVIVVVLGTSVLLNPSLHD